MKPKIKYEPRKEIIIHEYTKYDSPEDLINASAKGAPPGSVVSVHRWVDAVLLSFTGLPKTDVTIQEILDGRVHWDHVNFAIMPEYKEQFMTESGVTVIIGNVSENASFKAVAEFIKEQLEKKEW